MCVDFAIRAVKAFALERRYIGLRHAYLSEFGIDIVGARGLTIQCADLGLDGYPLSREEDGAVWLVKPLTADALIDCPSINTKCFPLTQAVCRTGGALQSYNYNYCRLCLSSGQEDLDRSGTRNRLGCLS